MDEPRIASLEREVRALRRRIAALVGAGFAILVVLPILLLSGAATQGPKVIEAEQIVLLDPQGRVAGRWTGDGTTGAALTLYGDPARPDGPTMSLASSEIRFSEGAQENAAGAEVSVHEGAATLLLGADTGERIDFLAFSGCARDAAAYSGPNALPRQPCRFLKKGSEGPVEPEPTPAGNAHP